MPGRNPGDVWTIPTGRYRGEHAAVGSLELARRCVAAGCKPAGVVCDPFSGTATTGLAALSLGHPYVGIELNPASNTEAIHRLQRHQAKNGRDGSHPGGD
jgi:DNA modification methylase